MLNNKIISILVTVTTSILGGCSGLISNYPDLGSGYKFIHEGKHGLSIVNDQNSQVIKHTVLEYNFDSVFIIASQRPWDSIPGIQLMNYSESNKAFENSSFKQFWIINKKEESIFNETTKTFSNVYGPYSKEEYEIKREDLGVPHDLKLVVESEGSR